MLHSFELIFLFHKNEKEFSSYHLNELISIRDYEKIKLRENLLSTNSIIFKDNFESKGKRFLLICKCLYQFIFCGLSSFKWKISWILVNELKEIMIKSSWLNSITSKKSFYNKKCRITFISRDLFKNAIKARNTKTDFILLL